MALTPPVAYRPVQDSDIAVGKDVVYVSRAPGGKELRTRVEDEVIIQDDQLGPCIRLEAKHLAQMSRICVPTIADSLVELPGTAAVGAVAPTPAAVGAVVPATPDVSDGANDANMFLKVHVAPWIESMAKDAQEKEVTLPEVLKERLTSFFKNRYRKPSASSSKDLVIQHMRREMLWKT